MMDYDTGREMDGRVVQGGDEMPDDVNGQVLDQTSAAPSAESPVIDNETLMEQVLDAIRTGRFWVLTHPEYNELIERRFRGLLETDEVVEANVL